MELELAKRHPESRDGTASADLRIGQALGWFSVGLGLSELLAPREVARLAGVKENVTAVRLVGLRELLTGLGLLAAPEAPGWRWARVAGDAMDLALLGAGAENPGRAKKAALAVAGITALDVASGLRGSRRLDGRPATAVVTVDRNPEDCARAWSDPAVRSRVGVDGEEIPSLEPAPGGRGTILKLPASVAARKRLGRFKQLLEIGTIATTEGQPEGPRSPGGRLLKKKGERA